MPIIDSNYSQVRNSIAVGDVFAFGGDSTLSKLIKLATQSGVSHVATVTKAVEGGRDPVLVESAVRLNADGTQGTFTVSEVTMDVVLQGYPDIWWLPLGGGQNLDNGAFLQFILTEAIGKVFDLEQAYELMEDEFFKNHFGIRSDKLPEDLEKYFCSELVAEAFERGGLVGAVNASNVTPIDLCRWGIYQADYHRLKGTKEIYGHNTLPPEQSDLSRRWV